MEEIKINIGKKYYLQLIIDKEDRTSKEPLLKETFRGDLPEVLNQLRTYLETNITLGLTPEEKKK